MTSTKKFRKIRIINKKTRKQYGGSNSQFNDFLNALNRGIKPRLIINIDNDIVEFFNSHIKKWQIKPDSTLYQIYDISPDAENREIIIKSKTISKKLHTDKIQNSDERIKEIQNNTFSAIREISAILLDKEKRIVYDELLNPAQTIEEQEERKRQKEERKRQKEEQEQRQEEEERIERERYAQKQLEIERLVKEQLERERLEQLERERELDEEMRELDEEIRNQERKKRLDKAEEKYKNKILEQKRLEKERLEKEILEKERLERERLERERLEEERLERERLEQERLERERLKQEQLEKERLEHERIASIFRNTLKPQTNIITNKKVIEGLNIYDTVNKYPNVFHSQFNFKGGKKTYNKRYRFKKTKKTRK